MSFLVMLVLPEGCSKSGSNPVKPPPPPNYGTGRIVFVQDSVFTEGIYFMNPDGTGATKIPTDTLTSLGNSEISPDGTRVLFGANGNNGRGLYTMNIDGSSLRFVASASITFGGWSPDGSRFAYTDDFGALIIANADGSNPVRVTSLYPKWNYNPKWSPDGTRISFYSDLASTTYRTDIYVVKTDGTGLTQITTMTGDEDGPDWSPDGTLIAFSSRGTSTYNGGIYTIHPDGTGLKRLTTAPDPNFTDWFPNWSPDAKRIVFSSDRANASEGVPFALYSVNADGTGLVQLTHPTSTHQPYASWGPKP
jgi:Tol biopolymer transport system component